jgi:Acetyltransferase (GNAT) domain
VNLAVWSTRESLPADFERAWESRLSRAPYASYAMRLDWLRWEAGLGRHGLAVLVDRIAGALVLRAIPGGWESGWPWRWQAVVEDDDSPTGLDPVQCAAFLAAARSVSGGARVRFYGPGVPPAGAAGWPDGGTVHQSLAASEDELFMRLDDKKRRNIKRARRDGFTVVVADRPDQFRAFKRLQIETEERRGATAGGGAPAKPDGPAAAESEPAPGHDWREWELPWQRLLVAEREGVVEAGSGFGFHPGGTLDYRANASSVAGKKSYANMLLGWEAIRSGRELGLRRINWGGATRFKRDLGGDPVDVWCALEGGPLWAIPNAVSASIGRARPRISAWWRSLREPGTGGGGG